MIRARQRRRYPRIAQIYLRGVDHLSSEEQQIIAEQRDMMIFHSRSLIEGNAVLHRIQSVAPTSFPLYALFSWPNVPNDWNNYQHRTFEHKMGWWCDFNQAWAPANQPISAWYGCRMPDLSRIEYRNHILNTIVQYIKDESRDVRVKPFIDAANEDFSWAEDMADLGNDGAFFDNAYVFNTRQAQNLRDLMAMLGGGANGGCSAWITQRLRFWETVNLNGGWQRWLPKMLNARELYADCDHILHVAADRLDYDAALFLRDVSLLWDNVYVAAGPLMHDEVLDHHLFRDQVPLPTGPASTDGAVWSREFDDDSTLNVDFDNIRSDWE